MKRGKNNKSEGKISFDIHGFMSKLMFLMMDFDLLNQKIISGSKSITIRCRIENIGLSAKPEIS